MNYNSYDRFQGAWLGSIIGEALGQNDRTHVSNYQKIINYQFCDWIETREKIAWNIVRVQRVETQYIVEQLTPLLSTGIAMRSKSSRVPLDGDRTSDFNNIHNSSISITSASNFLSALLPIITFAQNNGEICTELIGKCNLKSVRTVEIKEDILLWTRLLSLTFTNPFQLENINVSIILKLLLSGVEVRTTSSIAKWNAVGDAIKHGFSLQQLTEQISQINKNNSDSNVTLMATDAICLALYCFASTPHNFMLSVQCASHLPSNLSQPVAALTATISGAYNGITGIPRNWRNAIDFHPGFQQAIATCDCLYQTWLGTYKPNNRVMLYNPSLHALATPKIIQSRKNFKVISQNL